MALDLGHRSHRIHCTADLCALIQDPNPAFTQRISPNTRGKWNLRHFLFVALDKTVNYIENSRSRGYIAQLVRAQHS